MKKINKTSLDNIAKNYSEDKDFEERLQKYKMLELEEVVRGKRMLDVGCGIGKTTKYLAHFFDEVVGIDGSKDKINKARKLNHHPNIKYILTMIDNYLPSRNFDTIVCTNVLEHMPDPATFLNKIKSWLVEGGRLIVTVPNARAFHKLLGVKMGVTNDLFKLTEADVGKGHFIVFDRKILEDFIVRSGFKIIKSSGILFKPFPSNLMETIPNNIVDGLYEMGKEFPDLCSSLLVVGEKI
ncbi:MAG: methyltransferase domain-containing protein [Microgenomates group bacterium]